MSIGDKITIQLGDVLFHQSCWDGTKPHSGKQVSNFVKTVDLEIVGTYRILADRAARVAESDWNYTENTIFVPGTILPIEIPADYETAKGEYSVLIEDADDIRAFREDAELSAEEMGVALIFSDGGWLDIEKSFEAAQTVSTITIILYLAGAGLALILAVYLYIGRNKKEYAIMRSLGVSELEAGKTIMLPLAILSIAMPIGGIAGFFYASKTADGVLKKLAESVSGAYVCDSAIPGWIFFICLFLELIFTMFIALIFLKRVRKIPPLELLAGQQGMGRPPVNPMAATSLVLGIISLLVSCCCFPVGFIVGFVLAMVGLVLAISSKKGKPFSGYAIAGLIVSILGICESLFLFFSYILTVKMMQDPNFSSLMNQIMEQYERSLGPQMISSILRKLL